MTSKTNHEERPQSIEQDPAWKDLLKIGGLAALLAGVIFRRNIGPEVSLVTATMPPSTTLEWFTLFQENRILGLIFLDFLDVIDYLLVGLMFLAIYIPLRRTHGSQMLVATVLGLIGITIYITSNTAFSMQFLSDQYAVATSDAERAALLAAGETILALSEGTGIYVSFILLAIAGLIISVVILNTNIFSRPTAYVGILAGICDLIYCITYAFTPEIGVLFISAAGLFLMIWHILVGRTLYQLSRI